MKKWIKVLWSIAAIAVIIFIVFIIAAPTDAMRWRAFSVCLPVGYLAFLAAAVMSIIEYIKLK